MMHARSIPFKAGAALLILIACLAGAEASVGVEDEEVVFRLSAHQAASVFLVGDFNGWNPTIDKMIRIGGEFEIRLYLLPGAYRYRFIVDGESMPDPDNHRLDADGNSLFFLVETVDGLAIAFDQGAGKTGAASDQLSPKGSSYVVSGSYRDAAIAVAGVEGSDGDRVHALLLVDYEMTGDCGDGLGGDAFFVRGAGTYRFSKGKLVAFTREADLDLADPARLFGEVGLYRYPLGIFCRGLIYEGRLPLGLEGKAFFANRMHGYESGIEGDDGVENQAFFSDGDRTDSDLMGLKVGSRLWRLRFAYLMRSDKRPRSTAWVVPGSAGEIYRGFEKVRIDGVWVSLSGDRPLTFEAEVLAGKRHLSSTARSLPDVACCPEEYEADMEWEDGIRFHAGLRYRDETKGFRIAIDQTTLDGERILREGRSPGERIDIQSAADLVAPFGYLGAKFRMEHYSADNTGEVFWFKSRNFFLDGDDVRVGRLPFAGSRDLYEIELVFMQPMSSGLDSRRIVGPPPGTERDTYGEGIEVFAKSLTVSLIQRGEGVWTGDRVREIRFSKGVDLHDRIRVFLDMRHVSYRLRDWKGEKDFLDAFVALCGRIGYDSWVSVGLGVNPYYYDRWLHGLSDMGREHYLMGEGAIDPDTSFLSSLEEAERSLSEEWSITFEAFVRFW
jgi:hypothetical protein